MTSQTDFHGPNAGYVLELYERYRNSPESVDESTREFFKHWTPPSTNGHLATTIEADVDTSKIVGVVGYAQAIRQFGHLDAKLSSIGAPPLSDPELKLEAHGITEEDLRRLPASLVGGAIGEQGGSAWDATNALKEIYSSSIGYDNDHIRVPEERQWLREAAESRRYRFDPSGSVSLLERLTQIEAFEHFLQKTFPTKYRFSIEGLDMMIPILDEIINDAVKTGTTTISIGMAHRGRLNVLAHIMNKPYDKILADFKDPIQIQELQHAIGWTVGDVKYHKGVQREVGKDEQSNLKIIMPPNPSHLEAINPVVVGISRAAGTSVDQPGPAIFNADTVMQILIHGDASFPGQGLVAETFNLSGLPGYWTGGSIHIIANNQIGFTTLPKEGRSTIYASDLAKGFKVPIIHVNADDPAACIEVANLAFAYQEYFEKDILIDLIGYRRYGHNELDEPSFTQPLMYEEIRSHPTVRTLWSEKLIKEGKLDQAKTDSFLDKFNEQLTQANEHVDAEPEELAEEPLKEPPAGMAKSTLTAVTTERLLAINDSLELLIKDFNFYSRRLEGTIRSRREALRDTEKPAIDWATAEEMAFATILEDGIAIRMTGQDCERGTFSHRHAVLHDAKTGQKFTPLQALPQAKAAFEIHNSPLSESAVIGFEYGYNVQAPDRLVLWEAQYGDFNNNAQLIIDEFIVSAREKWGLTPSLVMLLPHGHEGAGPDHSSGRVERYLQMAANTNMRIANVTSAAQYYHLLRRQALLLQTDPLPLIMMTPKSLLRNPAVASSIADFSGETKFQPVINDSRVNPKDVDRIVFCSGKFYFDLIDSDYRQKYPNVAIVRVEQLYPFPLANLKTTLEHYPNIKQIVWAQEEPKNMGAWEFMGYRLKKLIGRDTPVNYVGRRRSSSPAEGSKTAHTVNQSMIIEYAFNWDFDRSK